MIRSPHAGRLRSGFTLLELVIALAVGATILLAAMQLATSISMTQRSLRALATERMQRVNAISWLRARLATADPPSVEQPFVGREHELEFRVSRDERQIGGWVRSRIVVDSGALVAESDDGGRMVLRTGVQSLTVDYLNQRGRTSPWLPTWTSESALPAAVRLRLVPERESGRVDTLLFSVRTAL